MTLPNEILGLIFDNVDCKTVYTVLERVCKTWCILSTRGFGWSHLYMPRKWYTMENITKLLNRGKTISRFRRATSIHINLDCIYHNYYSYAKWLFKVIPLWQITGTLWLSLNSNDAICNHLFEEDGKSNIVATRLRIDGDIYLEELSKMVGNNGLNSIQTLELSNCAHIHSIVQLSNVSSLTVRTDACIEEIATMNLKHLKIYGENYIDGRFLEYMILDSLEFDVKNSPIPFVPALKRYSISVYDNSVFPEALFPWLEECKIYGGTTITDLNGAKIFKFLDTNRRLLRILHISNINFDALFNSLTVYNRLTHFPKLEEFYIEPSAMSSDKLEFLAKIPYIAPRLGVCVISNRFNAKIKIDNLVPRTSGTCTYKFVDYFK